LFALNFTMNPLSVAIFWIAMLIEFYIIFHIVMEKRKIHVKLLDN